MPQANQDQQLQQPAKAHLSGGDREQVVSEQPVGTTMPEHWVTMEIF